MERRLAAILAADVVGYSRLIGVDEAGTLAALRALRKDLVEPTLKRHRGRIVNLMGDGLLAEFSSVVDAVAAAVEIQEATPQRSAHLPEDRQIALRVSINVGDVVVEDGDLFGDGVNIAARLQEIADPGGIAVSGGVYRELRGKLDLAFVDMGERVLKNIADPVRTWQWSPKDRGRAAPQADIPPISNRPSIGGEPRSFTDLPSVAVLPFENLSDDPEQGYFADGIAEDIITTLSKLSQLVVIARNSSFVYRGRAVMVQEIAKDLGVGYIVEGSVRKSGDRVRVTAQLVNCSTGGHLWAERFDRELTDIFAIQDDVARQTAAALKVKLSEPDRRRMRSVGTDNMDAYDRFLRGREYFWQQTKDKNLVALGLFNRSKDLDPSFAPTYAFLSFTHMMDYINEWTDVPEASLAQAGVSAERGVKLNDDYPWSRVALGNVSLWKRRYDRAIAEYETAIGQDPNFALGYMGLGWVLHYVGRSKETIDLIQRGIRLDPHYPDVRLHWLAQAYYQLGCFNEAADTLSRRLVRKPDSDISRVLLAACYGQLGRHKEAEAEWVEALRINPKFSLERRRQIMPYKNPADFEAVIDGLRKAGLLD